MDTRELAGALTGGTVPAWLALLNSMVFVFPSRASLVSLHDEYRSDPVTVLGLDTGRPVAAYGALIRVASIDTGSIVYAAAERGRETFQGIAQFDPGRRVMEVAVVDGIPDLGRYLVTAERWEPYALPGRSSEPAGGSDAGRRRPAAGRRPARRTRATAPGPGPAPGPRGRPPPPHPGRPR